MNRREFIGVGLLATAGCQSPRGARTKDASVPMVDLREEKPTPKCPRPAHQTAGPFYVKEPIMRSEIAEGQAGRALSLRFVVVDEKTCAPRPDVLVSLFHANADGIYSGFTEQGIERDRDTSGQTWLRGAQRSGADGSMTFNTIYPGWYPGRVSHMHFTALVAGKLVLTSQIYFPDDIMKSVYSQPPYSGWRDTEDANDPVRLRAAKKRGILPRLAIERGRDTDLGTLTIALPPPKSKT